MELASGGDQGAGEIAESESAVDIWVVSWLAIEGNGVGSGSVDCSWPQRSHVRNGDVDGAFLCFSGGRVSLFPMSFVDVRTVPMTSSHR